jgi:O-antigen/teichoic acid export membrane protein
MDSEKNLATATMALTCCIFTFLIGIPISLINRVLNGFQTAYIANNVLLVGKGFALFSIFLAVWLDLGLVGLAVLFIASPLLVMFFFSLYFFTVNFDLMPRYRNVKRKYMKEILGGGLWTVFIQMVHSLKINMPVVIVSASLGSVAVAEYAIAQKFTALGAITISVALQSLWPVYGEAYSRGDRAWIVSALVKSVKLVLILTVIGSCIFIFLGQQVIEFWLGDSVIPTLASIVGFCLLMIVSSVNICFAMLLNGTGNFKNQSLFLAITVIFALSVANIIAPDYGIIGVVLAMLVAELFRIPVLYLEAKRVISKI